MDMFGHNREAVKQNAGLVAVAKKCGDEQFGVRRGLEESAALMRDGGEGIGFQPHARKHIAEAEAGLVLTVTESRD